jgi:sulfate adenylyltransferase subunit 2
MLEFARRAFHPSPPPFPLLHVDTTWKFNAMYEMRERMAHESGMNLLPTTRPAIVSRPHRRRPLEHDRPLPTR